MAYNFTFSDQDLEVIDNQARDFTTQFSGNSNTSREYEPRLYIPFLKAGNYLFRIYPDRTRDGFVRLTRQVQVHRGIPIGFYRDGNVRRIHPKGVWADKRIDDLLQNLQKQGIDRQRIVAGEALWTYMSQSYYLTCIHMFESSNEERNPSKSSYIVQLNNTQHFAFQDWIQDRHPEQKRLILDPNNDNAPGIRMSIKKKPDGKYNINFETITIPNVSLALPMPPKLRDAKLPDMFHDFNGLDSIMITEEDRISDEEFFEFKKIMYAELEKYKASAPPPKDTTQLGYKLPSDERGKTLLRDELDDDIPFDQGSSTEPELLEPESSKGTDLEASDEYCLLADKIKAKPDMMEAYGNGVRYGNRPNRSNPYCLVCDIEEGCIQETVKNQNSQAA
jgi:hypothetical protein